MKQIFIFIMLLMGLSSCHTSNGVDPTLNREWMLIEIEGFTKENLVMSKAKLTLNKGENQKVLLASAKMGCNTINFEILQLKDNNWKIKPLMKTAMACEDMSLEESFIGVFSGEVKHQINGHFLIMTNEKNQRLKFVASDWD